MKCNPTGETKLLQTRCASLCREGNFMAAEIYDLTSNQLIGSKTCNSERCDYLKFLDWKMTIQCKTDSSQRRSLNKNQRITVFHFQCANGQIIDIRKKQRLSTTQHNFLNSLESAEVFALNFSIKKNIRTKQDSSPLIESKICDNF